MVVGSPLRAHVHERGFTLVELVVVSVLLTIVMAIVGRALIGGFQGSASVQTATISAQAASEAIDAIRQDLKAAYASDRDRTNIRNDQRLSVALRFGVTTLSDDPAANNRELDVRDIIDATPTRLDFRADINPARAGSECIRYELVRSGDRIRIDRSAFNNANCTGSPAQTREVLKPTRRIPGQTFDSIFTYHMLQNPTCDVRANPSPIPAAPATLRNAWMNRIVAVEVQLGAAATRGSGTSASSRSTMLSLRSRETLEYRRALECA